MKDLDFLFLNDFPAGVKTIVYKGHRLDKVKFLEMKKAYEDKRNNK